MSSAAEQSIKELFSPAWGQWSPEKRQRAISSFQCAVTRLAKQIESDMYNAAVKPARGDLKDAAK